MMSLTHDDLDRFHAFATAKVSRGQAATFDELVALWKRVGEQADLESIQRGIADADADAGRTSAAGEAFERVRQSLAEKS